MDRYRPMAAPSWGGCLHSEKSFHEQCVSAAKERINNCPPPLTRFFCLDVVTALVKTHRRDAGTNVLHRNITCTQDGLSFWKEF